MAAPSWKLPFTKAVIAICGRIMTLACFLWNFDTPLRLGFAILTEQYFALQLGLSIFIVFLPSTFRSRISSAPGILGWLIALIGIATLIYTSFNYVGQLEEQAYRPPALTFG